MAPAILSNSALTATTDLAADLMTEIQGLVNSLWNINYNIPGGGGKLTGSPNNLLYSYSQNYQDTTTITPAVAAYTITPATTVTPAYTVPAVMSTAVPGSLTYNSCSWYGDACTTEVPGTPAYTITPSYVVPAVVSPAVISPAVPATTAGYSTTLNINATAQGISNALNPLFSSVTFKSGEFSVSGNSVPKGNETVTYNLDQEISGSAVRITGSASFDNLSVSAAGVTTNFGNISSGTLSLSPVPNIPVYFDAVISIPSYSSAITGFSADDVAYQIFPQASSAQVQDMSISTGVTALADFINNDLLSYLTSYWNSFVVPIYASVGATAPQAPSQTLANTISKEADTAQSEVNSQTQSGLNTLLKDQLGTIQPYIEAITAATWDYTDYPLTAYGYYNDGILAGGLFSGVNATGATFVDANCSGADFSNANLTDTNFSGAILTGTNFSGATGAPTSTSLRAAMMQPKQTENAKPAGPFNNSVIFGANFTNSSLDPSGAFYDKDTIFASGYNPKSNNLKYYSAAQFVAGNKSLIKAFGSNTNQATGAFVADQPACGCPNKTGIRTDVVTGKLALDGFNEGAYFRSLPSRTQKKFNDLLTGNPQLNKGDTLAMYSIAEKMNWDKTAKDAYIFSNSDLIEAYGSPRKAVKNARDNYLQKGFFQQRSLNNDSLYTTYVNTYPSALFDSGATFIDQESLAQYFLTTGYNQGQRLPSSLG